MALDKAPDNSIGYITKTVNVVNIPIRNEENRITKMVRRKRMLNDNFYDLVEKELGNVITSACETGLIEQIDDTNNIFKMVIEEISKVYDVEPTRFFSDNETEQTEMEDLYKKIEMTNVLEQSNIYMNAFNDCLIHLGYDSATGKYTVKLRTPDNFIVVVDNDLNLLEVYIYQGIVDKVETWYGYTKDSIFKIEVDNPNNVLTHNPDDRKPISDDNMEMVNPLGFIPMIPLHNGYRDDSFFQNYKGDDLVKGNIQIAIKLTILNQLIKFQSFKQLVATASNGNSNSLDNIVIDPASIIYLFGEESKIDVLDLESNYKQLWETIQAINQNLATNYKISPTMFKLTAAPSSGFALKMENIKLDKFVVKQQGYYSRIELQIFNMLKLMDETLKIGVIKGDKFVATFQAPTYPKTTIEILEEQEKAIALGKTNMIDILMKEQGLTEEEATAKYNENIKLRNQSNEQFNATIPTVNLPIEQGA